jgi:hypothetical protein
MNNKISNIKNNVQDRESEAWLKLCTYIDELAENGKDEFVPREYLGDELFAQIHTLPETISKLKKVKKIGLYGSSLKRIPPEIGNMESLEYFDIYTSYDLHWFPYELTKCKKLKDSRISTRTLYGNFKNRMGFPKLDHNPVRYFGETLTCSVCEKKMKYSETNQFWITLKVGTDVIPLLANVCSTDCASTFPNPPKFYVPYAHMGGADLEQPEMDEWEYMVTVHQKILIDENTSQTDLEKSTLLKLIRKIWEK